MNWFEFADAFFQFRPAIAVIVAVFFAVPLVRTVWPVICTTPTCIIISARFGIIEVALGWLRGSLVLAYLVGVAAWNAYRWIAVEKAASFNGSAALAAGALALIACHVFYRWRSHRDIFALIEFAVRYPTIYPQEFMTYYYAMRGPLRCALPETPYHRVDPAHIDFRHAQKKTHYTIVPFIKCVITTMIFARMLLRAERKRGEAYARDFASNIAVIWASYSVYATQSLFRIDGIEKLAQIQLPFIYCFTHSSSLDFALVPLLALAHARSAGITMSPVPCFLLARDHFIGNPLLHSVIGIGRAAELFGMIFVERRSTSHSTAQEVTRSAVAKLLEGTTPIAIYPQGSRARSRTSFDGTRLDAGYYAVGSLNRLKIEGGHFKKGVAYMAIDTARALAARGAESRVAVIPAAFIGAANVLPRRKFAVQLGVSVTLKIGDPIMVTPEMVAALDPVTARDEYVRATTSLAGEIDNALKTVFRVHAELDRRFFEDVRGMLHPLKMEEISIAMKQWRKEDYLIYVLLDYLYACRPSEWGSLLGQLVHLILNDAPREELVAFKGRIAALLPK